MFLTAGEKIFVVECVRSYDQCSKHKQKEKSENNRIMESENHRIIECFWL